MSEAESWKARRTRLMNRIHARLSSLSRPATGFTTQPEPRSIGSFARGRQLTAGNFMFAGYLVEAPETAIWDLPMPDAAFEMELHGFTWLDDLASCGDVQAQARARDWTHGWITRYGRGTGPGWVPDIAGRRLIRWVNHAVAILNGADEEESRLYFRSLAQQVRFAARRWRAATPGLPRFEALCGLIYAGLALEGMDRHVAPALYALDRECKLRIDDEGGIPSRCPEELLEVFALFNWAGAALREAGREPSPALVAAIGRVAPTLRALRHADGGLARFHGGGRGAEGRLDAALANAGVRRPRGAGLAMGFARLSHGRTTILMDAAAPPAMEASANAHASTLAFELTSGRRPVIVNCGSGRSFGEKWRRAGRATASHSTLALEGYSSSRLGRSTLVSGVQAELLMDAPRDVRVERRANELSTGVVAGHDGYLASHGLTHVRQLYLSNDGRGVQGEDVLATIEKPDERRFDRVLDGSGLSGIPFKLRFHLHPDADAELDLGGTAVSIVLKSGEIWVFRHKSSAHMSLEPSVYLEKGRLAPRATRQIVLSSAARDYATRVSWSLAKARETPDAVRDLERDELPLPI
jgi:uncharacterized heparinase superfamily protein